MPEEGLRVQRLSGGSRPGVHHRGAAEAGRDRHPGREALAHAQEVGHDAFVIAAEEHAGPAEAGVDLVRYEQQAPRIAQVAQRTQEPVGRHALAPASLHGLDEHGADRYRRLRGRALNVREIAEAREHRELGQPGHERVAEVAAPRRVEGSQGQAVVGALEGDDTRAARRQQRGRAAIVGWAVFVGAILVLGASMLFRNSIQGYLGQLVAVVTAMAVGAWLYEGRTDFTR